METRSAEMTSAFYIADTDNEIPRPGFPFTTSSPKTFLPEECSTFTFPSEEIPKFPPSSLFTSSSHQGLLSSLSQLTGYGEFSSLKKIIKTNSFLYELTFLLVTITQTLLILLTYTEINIILIVYYPRSQLGRSIICLNVRGRRGECPIGGWSERFRGSSLFRS